MTLQATDADFPPDRLAELTALLEGLAPSAGATRVLAIDGRSGAGKSTLAHLLSESSGATVVSLEYLYGGWNDLEGGATRLVTALLEPLAAGREAVVPQYDWVAGTWGDPLTVTPGGLLLTEGVGSFARAAEPLTGAGIWLEAPEEVRHARATEREGGAAPSWWQPWALQEEAHLAREATPDRATVTLLTG